MSSPAASPDPDTRALLALLGRLNFPGWETMPAAAARAMSLRAVENTPLPAISVGAVQTLSVPTRHGDILVRRFNPLGPTRPTTPALVYFHGGGWVLAHTKAHDFICRYLCRMTGAPVLAVDYPLAPEHPFPEPVEATADVWRWLVANAAPLGLDPSRMGVAGDSAGGNLAAVLALMARDGNVPAPKAQVLLYPALDCANLRPSHQFDPSGLFLKPATMAWFLDQYLPDPATRTDWRASPLLAPDHSGLAPAYVLIAGHDLLADEGEAYAKTLEQAGVSVTRRLFPGQVHNFLAQPHVLPTAFTALSEVAEYLLRVYEWREAA